MASMYAVYHGPEGLKKIAQRVHLADRTSARPGLEKLGCIVRRHLPALFRSDSRQMR